MAGLPAPSDILEEYQLVEAEDRYRLLIDLGRQLEPMPDALKTDATKVRGCSASVWVYPTAGRRAAPLPADSNAAITKGIVALVLSAVQDKPAAEVAADRRGRGARSVRAREASQREPDAGRSQHDRAHQADRGANPPPLDNASQRQCAPYVVCMRGSTSSDDSADRRLREPRRLRRPSRSRSYV